MKVILPLVRKVLPDIIAQELVGVQPMTQPAGQLFTLKPHYGYVLMRKIVVNKQELLQTLKANRDKHATEYAEAYEVYVEKAIAKMKENLKVAKDQKKIITNLDLVVPQNFTDSYDQIISMLEMDISETVELDTNEFNQYVRDNWQWRNVFEASGSLYNAKIGASR